MPSLPDSPRHDTIPADELVDLLSHLLAGSTGKSKPYWREVIGEVEMLPPDAYIGGNWQISPRASGPDLAAIEYAVATARQEYPYIRDSAP